MHFHCSRELGGLLPLNSQFQWSGFNARWLTLDEKNPDYAGMFDAHKLCAARRARPLHPAVEASIQSTRCGDASLDGTQA